MKYFWIYMVPKIFEYPWPLKSHVQMKPYELNDKVWIKFVYIDQKYDNLKELGSVRIFFFF